MGKIKRNVYEVIPEYTKFLKMCIVCEKAGISSAMLNLKRNRKKGNKFLQRDVDSINRAISEIEKELKACFIKYDANRNVLIQQIKNASKYVKFVYIIKLLGKTNSWYNVRVEPVNGNRKGSCFSKDEIDSINLELLKIVTELERTELVLDSEE